MLSRLKVCNKICARCSIIIKNFPATTKHKKKKKKTMTLKHKKKQEQPGQRTHRKAAKRKQSPAKSLPPPAPPSACGHSGGSLKRRRVFPLPGHESSAKSPARTRPGLEGPVESQGYAAHCCCLLPVAPPLTKIQIEMSPRRFSFPVFVCGCRKHNR